MITKNNTSKNIGKCDTTIGTYENELASFKSRIKFGEMYYFTKQRFSWLQKKMLKIFFGFEVEDVGIEV